MEGLGSNRTTEDLQARVARMQALYSHLPVMTVEEEKPVASTNTITEPPVILEDALDSREDVPDPEESMTLEIILSAPVNVHEDLGNKRKEKPELSMAEALDRASQRMKR